MKKTIFGLSLILLMMMIPVAGISSSPPTISYDEAEKMILNRDVPWDYMVKFVQAFHTFAHSDPIITDPEMDLIIDDRTVIVDFITPIEVDYGPLEFSIFLEDQEYKNILPRQKKKPIILYVVGGVAAGLIVGMLLH